MQMQRKPSPSRHNSPILIVELPKTSADNVWTVRKEEEEGHGLIHKHRYPVQVQIQIEDNTSGFQTKAFCDPVIGSLQACNNSHGNIYRVYEISHILEHIQKESRREFLLTWFSCFDCDEQQKYRRVQMRVRGMSSEGCAGLRALLSMQAQQDKSKVHNTEGYKVHVGGARKRKSVSAAEV